MVRISGAHRKALKAIRDDQPRDQRGSLSKAVEVLIEEYLITEDMKNRLVYVRRKGNGNG